MEKIIILFISTFILHTTFAQNVGIGTNNPQEKLEINGKLKIDSIPITLTTQTFSILAADTSGIISKIPKDSLILNSSALDSGELMLAMTYGESISAGDMVSVGDGKTGYMSVPPAILVSINTVQEQTSRTKWVAQKFQTSSKAVGIKAVYADLFRTSGPSITVFKALIRTSSGGVPSSVTLGSTQLISVNLSSGGAGSTILVFNPPVPVLPNTDYHVVIIAYDSVTNVSNVGIVTNDVIPNSYLLTTSNSGGAWTTFPTRDCFIRIFETQTLESRLYESLFFDPNIVIPPGITNTFNYNPFSNFTDKGNAFLGIAKESGIAGETKKVSLGPIATIPGANLSIGTFYTISGIAGQLGSGGTRVGMGIGPTKILITH